ncbi:MULTISPECIES: twin-arginine translocase subunit TatC [Micromonospora]|uniref:twin-arginine translocase subunit TatC n=1 Tax=Micromonospora TaxID=1873 RepID=UPI0001C46EFF|nr:MULTISPECIES: twin-arginine translocase subunit TatC [Micromonospora]ADU10896.1 Sec-independent protein translocase, TatC subunit [Micromonospora sp. L5]SCL27150.1 sec-independent protein translocase protein TatC [Micromonospora aurantiaca]
MAFGLKKRGPSSFARAADGSMTLIEHIRELRNRLFRASLAILVGFGFGIWLAEPVRVLLSKPYCDLPQSFDAATGKCKFVQLGVADVFLLNLKIGLWVGLIIAAPIWLYQLWAFIAPGLHRHERRYAYVFTALAAPLFAAGAVLAFFVTTKGLEFLLDISGDDIATNLEVTRYISFVTNLILLFGVAFEFPLIVLMLNFVGLASAKRLLSWWRVAVFVFFAFSAVVTPTPDPFGMTALAICLCALYFAAVGVAFINDKRRGRGREVYAGIADDEVSPLDLSDEPVPAGGRIEASEPIGTPEPIVAPKPIERRYDDMT